MALRYTIWFFLIMLFQVVLLNNVYINSYIYPAFYVYFIILLPFETRGWVLLFSASLMGLGIDFFTNSLGLNTAAILFTAFTRPGVIRILKSKKEYEPGITPGIKDLGYRWFFSYALILILLHHTALFFLEVFSFQGLTQTLHRIAASSITTLIMVLLTQFFFFKHDNS